MSAQLYVDPTLCRPNSMLTQLYVGPTLCRPNSMSAQLVYSLQENPKSLNLLLYVGPTAVDSLQEKNNS